MSELIAGVAPGLSFTVFGIDGKMAGANGTQKTT